MVANQIQTRRPVQTGAAGLITQVLEREQEERKSRDRDAAGERLDRLLLALKVKRGYEPRNAGSF